MEKYHSIIRVIMICLHLMSSAVKCSQAHIDESFDTILHDHAFMAMIHRRPHTGALYNATLPSSLAGMEVSVAELRSKTLWRKGADFSDFVIPPKTLPVPYVKRLLIVYHNLGNWSSSYYSLPGYALIGPVIGFLVYDASQSSSKNRSRLELNITGEPMSVNFESSTPRYNNQETKCAVFDDKGHVFLTDMGFPNVCYSRSQGRFCVVVPLRRKQQQTWPICWIVGSCLAGALAVALVAVAAMAVAKRKRGVLEKEADDGECLETCWIVDSKLPRADITRTQPVLESSIITTLPNPKLSLYG